MCFVICYNCYNSVLHVDVYLRSFVFTWVQSRYDWKELKARSHGALCDCDLLYQEMECCL